MTFTLTQEQLEAADKWQESQRQIYNGVIGGRWTYVITPTSIGLIVKLIDNVTKAEIDLTKYDAF